MAPRASPAVSTPMSHSISAVSLQDDPDDEGPDYREYTTKRSKLIRMIDWSHVFFTFTPHIMISSLIFLVFQILYNWLTLPSFEPVRTEFRKVLDDAIESPIIFTTGVKCSIITLVITIYLARMDKAVYLIDFVTFEPPSSWKVSHDQIMEMMRHQNCFTTDSLDFMQRILGRSGSGQATAWPPGITQCLDGKPTDNSVEASRKEAEFVVTDIVKRALEKTNLKATEIDILVINCSLFSPTPSLCAMVVSKFGLRQDVETYNLAGMGCSASLISIDLAKKLLRKREAGANALVISTEVITPNLYHGNERGYLLQNTLFRCGGAAIVLSNKWVDGRRAKYKLLNTVRVQGNTLKDYECVYETQDKDGNRGVTLSKEIVKVAGKCMEKNLTTLGPYVLPLTEQIPVALSIVGRQLGKILGNPKWYPQIKHYVPDFKRGIQHFCIHAGGRAVIDGIEKNLKLEKFHSEPSRMALLNYGNTSSSSIWYELQYIQDQQKSNPLKSGHRIMQVAFGSGFKCTSGVWLKL
ncbi:hypothetical protein ScalyP_jg7397 [Parmales sp. scaly parma]|nr:hypothetical protein ScalyP_jg7397 [Parmales sp. scaly parma]